MSWLITYKEHFESISYLVTLLGIPIAIVLFFLEKRKERITRELEIYASAHDRYVEYLKLCLERPDLDGFDLPQNGVEAKACGIEHERIILFTILTAIMESAFIRYSRANTREAKIQWQGWREYILEWLHRPDFRRTWPVIGPQFSETFVNLVNQLADLADLSNNEIENTSTTENTEEKDDSN